MINIEVFSEEKAWSKKLKQKKLFFDNVCKAFPKKYQFLNKKVKLSLLLSNNRKIRRLNKNFRSKNKPTDVLSFPLKKHLRIKKNTYLGDIIISYNFVNNSKTKNLKVFKDRLIKIFIHGFLHLLNFDHKKDEDYNKMIREEKLIYKSIISKLN